ncbi:MAG: hypothetical protein ACRDGU_05795 [Actinomycetota bacterium]
MRSRPTANRREPHKAGGAVADWLDAYCWRCGSAEVSESDDGRLLCGPCRQELFGPPESPLGGILVSQRLYWESHALERCWLCMIRSVDPEDDLGLCPECRPSPRAARRPTPRANRSGQTLL